MTLENKNDQDSAKGAHIISVAGKTAVEFSRRLGADITQPLEAWREDYIQKIGDIITKDITPRDYEKAARRIALWSEGADMHLIDAIAQPVKDEPSEITDTLYIGILTLASLLEIGDEGLIPHVIPFIDAISFHRMETGEDLLDKMHIMYAMRDMHGIYSVGLYLENVRNGRALPSVGANMFYRNLIESYRDNVLGIQTIAEGDRKTSILRISSLAGICIANALHLVPIGERDAETDWFEGKDEAFCLRLPSEQFEEDLNSAEVEAYVLSTYDSVQAIGGCLLLVRGEEVDGYHTTGSWSHGPDETKMMVRDAEKQIGVNQKGDRTIH